MTIRLEALIGVRQFATDTEDQCSLLNPSNWILLCHYRFRSDSAASRFSSFLKILKMSAMSMKQNINKSISFITLSLGDLALEYF